MFVVKICLVFFISAMRLNFCSGEKPVVNLTTVVKWETVNEPNEGQKCESTIFYSCECELVKEESQEENQVELVINNSDERLDEYTVMRQRRAPKKGKKGKQGKQKETKKEDPENEDVASAVDYMVSKAGSIRKGSEASAMADGINEGTKGMGKLGAAPFTGMGNIFGLWGSGMSKGLSGIGSFGEQTFTGIGAGVEKMGPGMKRGLAGAGYLGGRMFDGAGEGASNAARGKMAKKKNEGGSESEDESKEEDEDEEAEKEAKKKKRPKRTAENVEECKQYSGWRENVIEDRLIFSGLGHCQQGKDPAEKLSPSDDTFATIDYYLRALTVNCIPDVKKKIHDILSEELLVLSDDKMHFELGGEIKNIIDLKNISNEDVNKLSMAFEMATFSKTYHQNIGKNYLQLPVHIWRVPGGIRFTRSTRFLTDVMFEYIALMKKHVPPKLFVRLAESFEKVLKTVLLKLFRDEVTAYSKCKVGPTMKCSVTKRLLRGDKFRMASLILFLRYSAWEQVMTMTVQDAVSTEQLSQQFFQFVKENKSVIRRNVAQVLLSE